MKRILMLAVAWLALSAVAAAAQTATANLGITIPTVLRITNHTGDWAMPVPTAAQAEAGATISSTNTLDIETWGNVSYKVTATAPAFTITPVSTADAGYSKPASDAALTNGATTAALNSGTAIITHGRGNAHDDVGANVTISFADAAGSYTTLVTLTIAAQ